MYPRLTPGLLKLSCAYEPPGDLVQLQKPTQKMWGPEANVSTSSQVILMVYMDHTLSSKILEHEKLIPVEPVSVS